MGSGFAKRQLAELNTANFLSLSECFIESCQRMGDKPAYSLFGTLMSFSELERSSRDFAAFLLRDCGFEYGDRVAIQLPNISQYPIVAWGVLRAGLVIVNTNPLYTERELIHQFTDSGARALVVYGDLLPLVEKVVPQTAIENVIVAGIGDFSGEAAPLTSSLPNVTAFPAALVAGAAQTLPAIVSSMEDLAVLQYTGGTTGVPKGAMLTQGNLFASMCQSASVFPPEEGVDEIILAPMPLYHIYGFTANVISSVLRGRLSVLIPNPRDVNSIISSWKLHPITGMCGINTLFSALMASPDFDTIDFSTLRAVVAGGTTLVEELATEWKTRTGCDIYEGYGLSETSATATLNGENQRRLGSVGVGLIGMELKVANEEGDAVPDGSEGELLIRGAQVMEGYWQRPEATAEVLDEDGWLKTGDVAVISDGGFVHIVDRLKDMIIVSGFNVYPNEVEAVVYGHPAVIECAAVGVPDAKTGEAIKLYVASSSPELDVEGLIAFCRKELTAYKVPRQIEFMSELPKTNVGKILRRELRDMARAGNA